MNRPEQEADETREMDAAAKRGDRPTPKPSPPDSPDSGDNFQPASNLEMGLAVGFGSSEPAQAIAKKAPLAAFNSGQLYDFACIYGIAAKQPDDQTLRYGDAAMELLRKAVTAGWNDASHMRQDTDLDALRERDDFQQLLIELER